jgi:hypothetical protein
MTEAESENFSETMFKRLWWQGYKGRFAALRWPTLSADTDAGYRCRKVKRLGTLFNITKNLSRLINAMKPKRFILMSNRNTSLPENCN